MLVILFGKLLKKPWNWAPPSIVNAETLRQTPFFFFFFLSVVRKPVLPPHRLLFSGDNLKAVNVCHNGNHIVGQLFSNMATLFRHFTIGLIYLHFACNSGRLETFCLLGL